MKLFNPEFAFVFLGGFNLAMGALHMILYLYNRHKKSNLVYSIGLVMVAINFTMVKLHIEEGFNADVQKSNIIINSATNGILLYFVSYYMFSALDPRLKTLLKSLGGIYLAGFTALFIIPGASPIYMPFSLALRFICYASAVVVCVYGLKKRVPNFVMIVMAALMLLGTEAFIAVDVFDFWDREYSPLRSIGIIVGYATPFLAYSSYLSKDLALTSKKLAREHIMNERLTREKYEQELITRKILEVQNVELERSVNERTREISLQKEELEAQAEKIQEVDKIKSRFFANISHEFRTPLTLILGPIKKRLSSSVDPQDQRELSMVYQNGKRLLQLVNQLLDLAKLESGSWKLKASENDIVAFTRAIVDAFQSMAEVRKINYSFRSTCNNTLVFFDGEKLDKIVNNLIANALKFTPENGSVSITLKDAVTDEKEYVEIIVADTGVGIEQHHLEKIFDRFYQVDASNTREYEGTGIGLAITKELVELHRGQIKVASEPGVGTTFTVRLQMGNAHLLESEIAPASEVHLGPETTLELQHLERAADGPVAAAVGKESILIVEDNSDLRKYIAENLRQEYTIIEAIDGQEGISLGIKEIPTLVISDVMMPKVDGLQLCEKLKSAEVTSHIPIIMLTAKSDLASKLNGLDMGADDYIPKPFDIEELRSRVRNLISNRKKLQQHFSRQLLIQPTKLNAMSADEKFLRRVLEAVEKNIDNTSFGVEVLAREVALSSVQLYRKLSALTGQTPNDFIRNTRLQRAADLLGSRSGNVAEIAYQVGYTNLSYFSKTFKEKFGVTPSEFAKQISV